MTADQLRNLFYAVNRIDLADLEAAGVVDPGANGGSDWLRFNNDIGSFVLKLSTARREKLAALIEAKSTTEERAVA